MKEEHYVRLTPRRAVLALALTAAAILPAAPATADDGSVYCFTVPGVWLLGDQTASSKKLCVPWPFSAQPGS